MKTRVKLTKSYLDSFVRPKKGQIEIRDDIFPNLRAIIYPTKTTLVIRKCYQNQRYYKPIATYPFPLDKARQLAQQFCNDVELGSYNASGEMDFQAFLRNVYIPHTRLYKKNLKSEIQKIVKWALPFIGKTRLCRLTMLQVEEVLRNMAMFCANSSVNRLKYAISGMLNHAISHGFISKNVASPIPKLKENNIRYRHLSNTELPLFVDSCENDENDMAADFYLLCLSIGIRSSEGLSIKRSQISSDFTTLIIAENKSNRPYTIYLNSFAKKIIKRRLEASWNDWLFPSSTNDEKPISPPYSTFKRICIRAGISVREFKGTGEPLIPHDLRRTFAQYCLRSSSLHCTSKLLNHAGYSVTEARYAHIQDSQLIEASELTSSSMFSKKLT